MKFGKHLEGRQLELPEYNGHFINYKALKKLIKQLSVPAVSSYSGNHDYMTLDETDESLRYQTLQENKASFFFKLERELEKVNEFYLEKEANLRMKFDLLNSRYHEYKSNGKLTSKRSIAYRTIRDGVKKFERDLVQLEQFVELNRTGFSKVLKKWDKRSHSHAKDFYLATVVSVQPIFTRNEVSKWNDAVSTLLVELDELSDSDDVGASNFYATAGQVSRSLSRNSDTFDSFSHNVTTNVDERRTSNSIESSSLRSGSSQTKTPHPNRSSVSSTSVGLFDIELEIESWYLEVLSISKLKDEEPRKAHIKTFVETKVQSFVDSHLSSTRIDKKVVINDSITKVFKLLLASTIDDDSLKVFWNYGSEFIDLTYSDPDDDLVFSRHNMFHEAAICPHQSRSFVLLAALSQYQNSMIPEETFQKLLNAQDIHGRIPLHYASELGKLDFVSLLINTKLIENVDLLDNSSKTPLVLSVINKHIDVTRLLILEGGVNLSPNLGEGNKPQFHPLNVACSCKNFEAAKIILEEGDINLSKLRDSQGLCPLHIVAKTGGGSELLKLLVSYGADPNEVDGFNNWPPIFYAIQEGHATTVRVLLDLGANVSLTDQQNLSQIFYALWEGHLSVLNVLLNYSSQSSNNSLQLSSHGMSKMLKPSDSIDILSDDQLSLNDSLRDIPDFTLPPPIIPLRKYGHNFLERKIFVKLTFKPEKESITLNKDDEMILSSPGRITLTSTVSSIIPRNIILPLQEEDERDIVFQIDNLDTFDIDIEIYPSFGTRLVAKTYVLPDILQKATEGTCNNQHLTLPLFDSRLRNVGKFDLYLEVIFPYASKPLEVTKYETYWKSTSGGSISNTSAVTPSMQSIVTSSSLSGNYCTIGVVQLNDGTLLASPSLICNLANVPLLFTDLNKEHIDSMSDIPISSIPDVPTTTALKELLRKRHVRFEDLLDKIDPHIQLDIKVLFPTESEIQSIPVKVAPKSNLNLFVESVLHTTFEHVRKLRLKGSTRSIVFSSTNPRVCSILNWKQPNFPVLFDMNVISEKSGGGLVKITSNDLSSMAVDPSEIIYGDTGTTSIKEAVQFSNNNNLLGIILPINLLEITLQLVDQVLSHGLLLIGSTKNSFKDHQQKELGINGIQYNEELVIYESADADDIELTPL